MHIPGAVPRPHADTFIALPLALPAAAASLAYLNARFSLSSDFALLANFVNGARAVARHERHDDINFFYVLEEYARSSRANHTFLIFEGRSWSYKQSYETVLKYGTWLKSKGVQKNEIVAMDFMNSDTYVWVWFGLWSIGAVPAFINYNLTGTSLLHTIRTSTARLVLVEESGRDRYAEEVLEEHGFVPKPQDQGMPRGRQSKYDFERDQREFPSASKKTEGGQALHQQKEDLSEVHKLEIVFFDRGLESFITSLDPVRQPNAQRGNRKGNDAALLIFTSGTTGLPKAAIVGWGRVRRGTLMAADLIPIRKQDTLYTSMPLYHASAALLGLCSVLKAGASVCIGKKFSHTKFWPEVRSSKATIIQYVGETCRYLLAAPKSDLDKDHNVWCAVGNGMRPDIWNAFKERFNIGTVSEFYAATESPGALWNRSTNSFSAGAVGRNGAILSLLIGSTTAIVKMDPDSEPPEPVRDPKTGFCKLSNHNEPGELLFKLDPNDVKAKYQGYFGNEKATSSKILRNVKSKGDMFFRSGDLMRLDKEGRWFFVDRLGDTFRWHAENVSTAEVAEALGRHDAVDEANVYGVLVPNHEGRAGCAAVILKQGENGSQDSNLLLPSPQTLKSLADHVKKSLAPYAVPLFVRITENMHTTGTNKQQKHLLREDGIDVDRVEETGDVLYWLRDGTYKRFTTQDLDTIRRGHAKL
jgi:acyl-CoA synthetase (AMP-forming)/AMP-acid ligase II